MRYKPWALGYLLVAEWVSALGFKQLNIGCLAQAARIQFHCWTHCQRQAQVAKWVSALGFKRLNIGGLAQARFDSTVGHIANDALRWSVTNGIDQHQLPGARCINILGQA